MKIKVPVKIGTVIAWFYQPMSRDVNKAADWEVRCATVCIGYLRRQLLPFTENFLGPGK